MTETLADELTSDRSHRVAHLALIALLFVITFLPTFITLHEKYSEIDSYYSHGYLIPLASGYMIWSRRKALRGVAVVPSSTGFWLLTSGLMLYVFARWWYVNVVADLSMLAVLGGLSLYLFGDLVTRQLIFPLAFLLFMIPLPKITIIYITFWLKLFAARMAAEIVDAMGIPVLLQGAFIQLPSSVLEIDNACSGLRSLIALTAVAVLFAYFLPVSGRMKLIFVVASMPVAFAANLTRIVTLILVSYLYGPVRSAFGITDFTTGLLVFAVALGGLAILAKGAIAWERRGISASAQR